jgi:photosystem II stability/assembly factor-like uncharacterized protein
VSASVGTARDLTSRHNSVVLAPLQPQAVSFADVQHGLVEFAGGRIEATTDGGRTWRFVVRRSLPTAPTEIPNPCRTDGRFTAQAGRLALALCGFVPGAGEQQKLLYRSRDGGHTWRLVGGSGQCPVPSPRAMIDCGGYVAGLALAPDASLAVALENRGTLWVSHDGGTHWTPLPSVSRPELDWPVGASALRNGRAFVLLAAGGGCPCRLISTRDAGRTWRVVHRWK